MKEILTPVVVAILSAVITAFFSIQIQFAKNKKEAVNQIKDLIIKCLKLLWVGYLVYSIIKFIISTEPITRPEIFSLIVYLLNIMMIIIEYVICKILYIIDSIREMNKDHLEITKQISACINCESRNKNE